MLPQYKFSRSAMLSLPLVFFHFLMQAQSTNPALDVMKSKSSYVKLIQTDSNQRMVDLQRMIPDLKFDLRYATTANFTGQKLYPNTRTSFLRLPAARALQKVQAQLAAKGLGLVIFDAYRPYGVTVKMWNLIHDERYVANPEKGSGHNRGIAVDLTIYELSSGKLLDMGTDFDHFSEKARHDATDFPSDVLNNRRLLKSMMEAAGFRPYMDEWWHYSLPSNSFQLLDLSFKQLK